MRSTGDPSAVPEDRPLVASIAGGPGSAATSTGPSVLEGRAGRRRDHNSDRSSYAHLDPLLARFAALSGDDPRRRQLRDELVAGFLPVVAHIARRYRDHGEPSAHSGGPRDPARSQS